jgi:L-lactate dehydrogenase complex protein LldG
MSQARENILARIRIAMAQVGPQDPDPEAATLPDAPNPAEPAEMLALFRMRWETMGGEFHHAGSPEELETILGDILHNVPQGPAAVAGSAYELVPNLAEILTGRGFPPASTHPDQARHAAVGLTAARMAVSYSGSILIAGQDTGERAGSLLPPIHIALVPTDRLRPDLKTALDHLKQSGPPKSASLITGASKTADIELTLVKGVHGPGRACAVMLGY